MSQDDLSLYLALTYLPYYEDALVLNPIGEDCDLKVNICSWQDVIMYVLRFRLVTRYLLPVAI